MKKENRERDRSIIVRVTEEELNLINEKMALAKISNRNTYMRKMAIDGFVINVDISEILTTVRLLRNISNNINQIAHHANGTGAVYKSDLDEIKRSYEELIEQMKDTLSKINMITKI